MNFPIRKIIFALILTLVVPALAQPREAAPVRLSKLADRLYEVLDGRGARGGACLGDQAVLLIDTKMDKQSVNQTLAALKQESGQPVKYVINTHSDGDHVNGNQYMPEEVTFIAHENCRQEMLRPTRDGKPSPWNSSELIRILVEQGKSLADIKPAFPDNEAALVETVYNEIKR